MGINVPATVKLGTLLKKGLTVTVDNPHDNGSLLATLFRGRTLQVTRTRGRGGSSNVLGYASKDDVLAGPVRLKLRLGTGRTAVRALRRKTSTVVTLTVDIRPLDGLIGAGEPITYRTTFTIKR